MRFLLLMLFFTLNLACKEKVDEDSGSSCNSDSCGLCPEEQSGIKICSFVASPSNLEQIILINYGTEAVDLGDFSIWDQNAIDTSGNGVYEFPDNAVVEGNGGTYTINDSALTFQINDSGENLILEDGNDFEVHKVSN